jgi:hypothetical protein
VTTNQKVSVTTWCESQDPVLVKKRVHRQFLPPAVIGLAGTLLLHSLAVHTALLGTRTHKSRPPEVQELGSSLNPLAPKPADVLVLVDIPKTAKTTDEIDAALASVREAIKDSPIPVTHLDPAPPLEVDTLALSADKTSDSSVDSGDGTERVRLFGIYSGQIQARVERVWRRPRTPVNEGDPATMSNAVEYFQCQVQIVQDLSGNVQEILLPNCNGSIAWQRSLVFAIQQASPLPAPPSRTVFSRSMTLSFVGYSYSTGSSEDGYEIPRFKTVQTTPALPVGRSTQLSSGTSSSTPMSSSLDPGSTAGQTSN